MFPEDAKRLIAKGCPMTDLGILHAGEATQERDWPAVPKRKKVKRLREVYWIRRAESLLGPQPYIGLRQHWHPSRRSLGSGADLPGDGFSYVLSMPGPEDEFTWLEVTEVFTAVPPEQIEAAMKARNRVPNENAVDFEGFLEKVDRGRPSRSQQRKAADSAVKAVERKLRKTSYDELVRSYGYGTLIVGLPLWFAVLPDDPWRLENALDDFCTRVALGLQELKREMLLRQDCAFSRIVVIWDTTSEAWRKWGRSSSWSYRDAANASLESPLPAGRFLPFFSDLLEDAIRRGDTPRSEAPSMPLHVVVNADKSRSGEDSYPDLVEWPRELPRRETLGQDRLLEKVRLLVFSALCKVCCFVKLHGPKGLVRWGLRRISLSHAWRKRVLRHRARILYRESCLRADARAKRRDHRPSVGRATHDAERKPEPSHTRKS